jgi:predicted ribosome quality control (RQC) complex YloA/Tae2 family protein
MVFYFTSKVEPTAMIYMGRDKHENEFLIKYAQHHDIWFHVHNLSSAHVYLRTKVPVEKYKELSEELIAECA